MPPFSQLQIDKYATWADAIKIILLSFNLGGKIVIKHLEGHMVATPMQFKSDEFYASHYSIALREHGILLASGLATLSADIRRLSLVPLLSMAEVDDDEIYEDAHVTERSPELTIYEQMFSKNPRMATDMINAFLRYQTAAQKDLDNIFAAAMTGWFSEAILISFMARPEWYEVSSSGDIFLLLKLAKDVCLERGGDRVADLKLQLTTIKQSANTSISELKAALDKVYQELKLYGLEISPVDKVYTLARAITKEYFMYDLMAFNQCNDINRPTYEAFCRTLLNTENSYALVRLQLNMSPVVGAKSQVPGELPSGSARLLLASEGRRFCSICFKRTGREFPHEEAKCHNK